jgi:pimeloyl-ACP methyl ester carboxylesterase
VPDTSPLAYDTAGPLGAPPIVFVHGSRVTRKMWLPQMEALADDFRVIALDLPGHGVLASTPFRLETALAVIDDVIRRGASGRALVVGLSLGGYLAMELARRRYGFRSWPEHACCSAARNAGCGRPMRRCVAAGIPRRTRSRSSRRVSSSAPCPTCCRRSSVWIPWLPCGLWSARSCFSTALGTASSGFTNGRSLPRLATSDGTSSGGERIAATWMIRGRSPPPSAPSRTTSHRTNTRRRRSCQGKRGNVYLRRGGCPRVGEARSGSEVVE